MQHWCQTGTATKLTMAPLYRKRRKEHLALPPTLTLHHIELDIHIGPGRWRRKLATGFHVFRAPLANTLQHFLFYMFNSPVACFESQNINALYEIKIWVFCSAGVWGNHKSPGLWNILKIMWIVEGKESIWNKFPYTHIKHAKIITRI